jgi:hypothetical protein
VDDGHDAVAAEVGMGVAVVGGAVRGPTGMADAGGSRSGMIFQIGGEPGDPATVATPALS